MEPTPAVPSWVRKRDGSTQPFDADKINRALFAATESAGQPDAFVARELTDSVLHFLSTECENGVVHSEQIAETLAKVVRELGQRQIAAALVAHDRRQAPPLLEAPAPRRLGPDADTVLGGLDEHRAPLELHRQLAGRVLAEFSLERVFSKNLAAAHREGLLLLGGLDLPVELHAAVIRPAPPGGGLSWAAGIFETLEHARQFVGRRIAIDAPERELAQRGARIGDTLVWVKEAGRAARSLGLELVLNLGCEAQPAWAAETDTGPLFVEQSRHENLLTILGHLDVIIDQVLQTGADDELRIDWHLASRDFDEESGRRRLLRLVRCALQGGPVTFVCDRPRREVSLAEGVDRNNQAVVQWVGLNLPILLARQGRALDPETFFAKVMSLARLAASAGVQKRDFLRRHGRHERPAFLLDRAHVALHLIGLQEVAERLLSPNPTDTAIFTPFAQELIRGLETTLAHEARVIHLRCLVDDPPADVLATGPQAGAEWKAQLKQAGRWHAACGRGTATLPLMGDIVPDAAEFVELLHYAWKQTSVGRVRLARERPRQTQLTADWKE